MSMTIIEIINTDYGKLQENDDDEEGKTGGLYIYK